MGLVQLNLIATMEIGTFYLNHVQQKQRGRELATLSRSLLRFCVSQPDRVVVPSGTGKDTERVVYLNPETLVEIVVERATGLANAEEPKGTEAYRLIFKGWEGRSASSLMDEMV